MEDKENIQPIQRSPSKPLLSKPLAPCLLSSAESTISTHLLRLYRNRFKPAISVPPFDPEEEKEREVIVMQALLWTYYLHSERQAPEYYNTHRFAPPTQTT